MARIIPVRRDRLTTVESTPDEAGTDKQLGDVTGHQ